MATDKTRMRKKEMGIRKKSDELSHDSLSRRAEQVLGAIYKAYVCEAVSSTLMANNKSVYEAKVTTNYL